ncbi:uncharacterized protein [Rutidosis leptorrhynchoides]|uniref:uncharacterized protein n=1 Tax=Rutidosis leptorrhynchoides TaxID=125765 RepID=UPI003A997FC7
MLYYNTSSCLILVYELVSNGSLDDYFGNTDKITNFSWSQRLQISLDIAHGLNYLHTSTKDKPTIIHRDIKSANILLDDEWVAKIGDFGLSKLHQGNQSTLVTQHIAGTDLYLDPEYLNTGKLKKKSDIYSFGVVLFELLFGRLAYDNIYKVNNETGLPSVARRCFNEGTLGKMVDPKLVEVDENILMLNEGLNQDSLHTFLKIAYQCLSETQAARPTMDTVIEELEKALNFHNKSKENLQFSLRDLKLATQNFNDEKCIGEGRYWKQYKGEISHSNADGPEVVVVKRWDSKSSERHQQFLTELKILFEYKHRNIVSLVGYCNEMNERIIVHEYASNGSLEKYVKDFSILTWMERLKICLDIANVVCHLHFGGRHKLDRVRKYVVVHRDIKTSSILLDADWQVKVSNFELCSLTTNDGDNEHVYYNTYGSLAYVSEDYKDGYLTQKSDVYSLGVILWEMITGRLAWEDGCTESLASLVTRHYCEEGKHVDELIPKDVMKQGALKSLTTFLLIATKCLYNEANSRPFALDVVIELHKALAIHEDEKIWKFMLPGNYKDIIKLSKTPEIYSDKTYQELYGMFVEGVLIQEDKLLLSISNIPGEMNIMVSSATFSYKNRKSHKSQSVPQSRFRKVAKMLDISNLKIKANLRACMIIPGTYYGIHLVFKFCDPRKLSKKPMYVNLKYRMGNGILHSYFATWRDDEWMMIELFRFFNDHVEYIYPILLESFSRCYCGNEAIYVQGIECRAIDKVKYEEFKRLTDSNTVLISNATMDDQIQELPSEVEEEFMISETDDDCVKVWRNNRGSIPTSI